MSEQDIDTRLYNCVRKYEEIVKQAVLLHELTESFNTMKTSKKKNGGSSSNVEEKERFDQVLVETITKFFHDLNTVTNEPASSKPSGSN